MLLGSLTVAVGIAHMSGTRSRELQLSQGVSEQLLRNDCSWRWITSENVNAAVVQLSFAIGIANPLHAQLSGGNRVGLQG